MNSALEIAIIADDLTGAADAGVQFCPYLGPIYMTGGKKKDFNSADLRSKGLSVFTNTRNIDPAQAADTIYEITRIVHNLSPRMIYKKIDSCLRGNLGSELDAMVSALHATASFVAPAFPEHGRTTVNDFHLIDGIQVNETEIGRDPLSPVTESRLSVLLSSQSQMSIGHIPLCYIEKGSIALYKQVKKLLAQGCNHIVFDAQKTRHLNAIASLARSQFDNVLLVGSAGLARSLARLTGSKYTAQTARNRPRLQKYLFVCGSASLVLARQAKLLADSTGWPWIVLDPEALTANKNSTRYESLKTELESSWRTGNLIISIAQSLDTDMKKRPEEIVAGLADVVDSLLSLNVPDALFLSGGDTAENVMYKINGSAILLHEEILPGLMRGEIAGDILKGVTVFTKPGAFGQPDALVKLVQQTFENKV